MNDLEFDWEEDDNENDDENDIESILDMMFPDRNEPDFDDDDNGVGSMMNYYE